MGSEPLVDDLTGLRTQHGIIDAHYQVHTLCPA